MIWPFRRNKARKKPTSALRIVVWALIIGGLIGANDLARPLEEMYRAVRADVRARPADGKIGVIAFDDRTLSRMGTTMFSRGYYSDALERLFAMGAKRVFFDETFARTIDEMGDAAFAETLKRHPGQIVMGAWAFKDRRTGADNINLPQEKFRNIGDFGSLRIASAPFGLSVEAYYGDKLGTTELHSFSSKLAGMTGEPNVYFHPDWSIQVNTIPTISLVDILDGKVGPDQVKGRDFILGDTSSPSEDKFYVLGQGWFPGVYSHAIAAQTLREANPRSIGWLMPLCFFALILAVVLRARSRRVARAVIAGSIVLALVIPLALDSIQVMASYVPAYIAFAVAIFRLGSHRQVSEARRQNATTLMPNLSALREEPLAGSRPIIAMRIRNYAAVGASFSESVENELISEVTRRLTLPGDATTFYQAEEVLYWLGPALARSELEGHVSGLARLMESLFLIHGRKIDVHAAFGIDADFNRPVVNRIGRALLAADTAASKHQPFMFNTSDNDEESAWELSLMSELDSAIDNGDIWIAYQPQFNLKDDTISGAEALVRWQHPSRGAISPEAFILPAEAHNRIGKLTFHVLEIATRAARPLIQGNPHFRLSINISASLMEHPNLPARIVEILAETGFPATNLTLEVTESAPFAESPDVAANLAGIAALGIELSIDDYGTGNATLEYLRSVPCQEIKIDRRFVTDLVASNGDMLLVESTIELAHGLGRRVIAEGIEDPETLELLRAIGCDTAQGYYLAKPMRIEALESLLGASRRFRAA